VTHLINPIHKKSAFTLVEILVAMGVFGLSAAALLTMWTALANSAMNMTAYAQRQNDQMRGLDYLKRDIRRASKIEIYNGATLVTGTTFGNELRLTIPDYYVDSREEDNAVGSRVAATPALTSGNVSYGAALDVRYYVSNGAVIRKEAGTTRIVADAAGAFTLSFRRETSGEIRSRVFFNQLLRSGSNRTLRRQVDILSGQRSQLQL
jgi:prepilin-type N-terminal cleavage/methylation domain-containing protein